MTLSMWTQDRSTNRYEVTSFGDANLVYVQGLPDVKGNISGFWDDTNDSLYNAAQSSDGAKMYLYPASTAISKYEYGTAWLDYSIDVGVSDAIKIAGTYQAAGSWGHK